MNSAPSRPPLAVFDVDRTLLLGDCLLLLGRARQPHALAWGLAWLALLPALLAKVCGRISTGRLKELFLERFVLTPAHDPAELQAVLDGPFAERLLQRLNPPALQRLRWHQQRGERVILCSASPRFILQPLADRLGVELLATEVAREGNRLLPRLQGANCKGPEKVQRLEAHLKGSGGLTAWSLEAYGDSRGDRELLRSAERPHYRSFADAPRPYPNLRLKPLLPVLAIALLGYGLLGLWSQGDQLLPLLARLWPVILAGLGLVLLGYGLRFLRWRLLLAALGERPPWRADARLWMGSYAFTATPGKSGEAVRSVLLRQECGTPLPASLAALLAERLSDGTAVLLLLLLNLPLVLGWLPAGALQSAADAAPTSALPWLLALAAAAFTLLPSPAAPRRRLKQLLRRLLPSRLAGGSADTLTALKRLLRPLPLLAATLIGAMAWGLEGVSLALLLQAMGSPLASMGGAMVAHTAAGLLGALSMLPGGLGSTEAGTVGLLALQGVPLATATTATLLIRLMTLWFATALGVMCLLLPAPQTSAQTSG